MRIGGGIDDYPARLVKITLMDKGNYLPFAVTLKELDLNALFRAVFLDRLAKIGISRPAVDIRFAYAEHVHVRSVYHRYFHKTSLIAAKPCSALPLLSMIKCAQFS